MFKVQRLGAEARTSGLGCFAGARQVSGERKIRIIRLLAEATLLLAAQKDPQARRAMVL
jgi:hypothetical protein